VCSSLFLNFLQPFAIFEHNPLPVPVFQTPLSIINSYHRIILNMLKRIIYEHTVSLVCFITIKFSETSGLVFQVSQHSQEQEAVSGDIHLLEPLISILQARTNNHLLLINQSYC
jgi:hypothetical protein